MAHHTTVQAVQPAQGKNAWREARKEDVTTAGPRHLLKPVLQKQLLTFEALLCNYKVTGEMIAPQTSEKDSQTVVCHSIPSLE